MNKWIALLLLFLSVSIALNIYLLLNILNQTQFTQPQTQTSNATPVSSTDVLFNWGLTEQAEELPAKEKVDTKILSTSQRHTLSNRDDLLVQANNWLAEQNFLSLETFLQNYLKRYPQDMDFLLIEAKLKVETTLLSDAIAHYYDLLRNPMTALQRREIEEQIQTLSASTIEQLTRNYSWDILAMFVEPLIQLEPSNRLYILSLALAYAELYQEGLMENVLASLDFDDPDAQSVRKIILGQQITQNSDSNEPLEADKPTTSLGRPIPLKQYGDQFVVEGILSNNPVALLIDTGASVTAVSKQYFDNLSNRYKINYLGSFNIGTAGGNIMARMYQFRELTIKHVTVQNLPVVILPMQSIQNADGLLGMNFLREFDFKIDQRQGVMYINE